MCNGVKLYVVVDSASTDGRYDSQLVSWLKLHLLVTRYVLLIDCKNQTVLKLHNPTENNSEHAENVYVFK